ncbi:Uncharacterized protein SCF082_LOCUS16858 [Durusdinium trenchii]|uniref:Uncharacterized protein n=1 Tax=Durusdinium trenchii TaxID=1381693 RepID=A0ABP0KFU7_9DINO
MEATFRCRAVAAGPAAAGPNFPALHTSERQQAFHALAKLFGPDLCVSPVSRPEGSVSFELPPEAFFRAEAKAARDLGVLAVAILRARRGYASVLELFAGSGLRAARYLAEGSCDFIWANEANQDVHQAVVVNLTRATGRTGRVGRCDDLLPEWAAPARSWRLQEGLPLHGCEAGAHPGWRSCRQADKDSASVAVGWRVTHWEARALLGYCRATHRQFDVVDVDAFGCWTHIGDALEAVRPGGLLYLTATGLTSWKPSRSFRALGCLGRCPPAETIHDQMCRALVWHVAQTADRLNLVAETMFTLYRASGDVYRLMFRVTRRYGESSLLPQCVGLCACGSFVGPIEAEALFGSLAAAFSENLS